MKKLLLFSLLLTFLMLGTAEANVLEDVSSYIDKHIGKTGIIYEFNDQEVSEAGFATILEDVYIERLDLDLGTDFDKAILAQASYIIKEGDLEPYVSLGVGLDRVESLDSDELGETLLFCGAGIKF